jgi:hypothetical protein
LSALVVLDVHEDAFHAADQPDSLVGRARRVADLLMEPRAIVRAPLAPPPRRPFFLARAGGRRSDDQLKLAAMIGAALRLRVIRRRVLPGVLRRPRRCQKDAWGRWLYRFGRGWWSWLGLGCNGAGQQEGTKRKGPSSIERSLHGGPPQSHRQLYTPDNLREKVSDVAQRRISGSEARACCDEAPRSGPHENDGAPLG